MNNTILVIDDDEKLNALLKEYLSNYGFSVLSRTTPSEGLKAIKQLKPDLIILDVMLPEADGFETCRNIRKEYTTPVIMLTARGDVTDRIVGLEIGADDYLPKPFEPRELVARIQTILRRSSGNVNENIRKSGGLSMNVKRRLVTLDDKEIDLTTGEFEILKLFLKRPGIVFSRTQILDSLGDMEWDFYNRSIDVLISRLRQKLKDDPKNPRFIKTVWGAGYMLVEGE